MLTPEQARIYFESRIRCDMSELNFRQIIVHYMPDVLLFRHEDGREVIIVLKEEK